jgi:hypothetical protein
MVGATGPFVYVLVTVDARIFNLESEKFEDNVKIPPGRLKV